MKLVVPLLSVFVLGLLSSCGGTNEAKIRLKSRSLMTEIGPHDVLVNYVSSADYASREKVEDCYAHIEEVMCLVKDNTTKDECLPGGEAYAAPFQELYKNYPPALQKMFCSLDNIYVLETFYATAYAANNVDEQGRVVGANMGIRKSVLDENLSLSKWASWKEQLNFGGDVTGYKSAKTLPRHTTSAAPGKREVNDFLYFVVAHEFGHMFDFANAINRIDAACTGESCPFEVDTWGDFSWETPNMAKADQDFENRNGLCFYTCKSNPLSASSVPSVYRGLHRSNFVSTYAASNPYDDFADSLGYVALLDYLQSEYYLDTNSGARYDIMAKLRSKRFAEKRQYIYDFLAGSILYPGDGV